MRGGRALDSIEIHDRSILPLLAPLRYRNGMNSLLPHAFAFLAPYAVGARPLYACSGIVFGSDWRWLMSAEIFFKTSPMTYYDEIC